MGMGIYLQTGCFIDGRLGSGLAAMRVVDQHQGDDHECQGDREAAATGEDALGRSSSFAAEAKTTKGAKEPAAMRADS